MLTRTRRLAGARRRRGSVSGGRRCRVSAIVHSSIADAARAADTHTHARMPQLGCVHEPPIVRETAIEIFKYETWSATTPHCTTISSAGWSTRSKVCLV